MKKLLLIFICIFGICACNKENKNKEKKYIERTGTVVDKKYFPKKSEIYLVPVKVGKIITQQIMTETIPEKYILKISYVIKKDIEIEVSKDEYLKTSLGSSKIFKEKI